MEELTSCAKALQVVDLSSYSHCASCHVDGLQHVVVIEAQEFWVCCAVYDVIMGEEQATAHQPED